jgi:antitoxin component of RelBE/YafQ-DinJ toxin-antitoxin module
LQKVKGAQKMCKEKIRFTMNLPKDKKEKAQALADEMGLTMTALVILGLNRIFEEEESKKAASKG